VGRLEANAPPDLYHVVLQQIPGKSETQTMEMFDECKIALGLGVKANNDQCLLLSKRTPLF
jgi:hypothetical protein